jgi:DNA-binding NarL/FixJ family response regulator
MKFVLVDDHFLIRDALRGILREFDARATIVEACCWRDASRLIDESPDIGLLLLDLVLPDRDGFAALEETRRRHPKIPVVILSAQCERDDVMKALDLGAVGFIPKSGERKVMLGALGLILSGGTYIPPAILDRVQAPSAGRTSGAELGLTARQLDVLGLMMQGKSNKSICRALGLAEQTVRNHVTAILRSLKASNRTEAVVKARELGLERPLTDDGLLP